MGKAGRWLRSFLTGKKDKKAKDKADSQSLSSTVPTPASTPSAKEKRRWSFRRPAAAASGKETDTSGQGQLASTSSHCFSVVHVVVQDQHAVAAPEVAIAAAMVVPPPSKRSAVDAEEAAAIKIQSAFRSYLARKALCALRGMVKLQAMVRGQLVRRQANMTLRRMQALVAAQKRARAERLRLLEDDKPLTRTPRPPPNRRSPQHHRSRMPQEAVDRCSEENVKIVEVDNGGSDRHGTPRACGRRSSSCYSTPLSRTPAKAEVYQKVSPTPSAPTDASARTSSGRFETNSVSFSVASEASGRHRGSKACHAADHTALLFPNYMANTESSRAKARSQSAPRQRPAVGSEAAATASPSPSLSCERPPSGRGGRCRLSLDPRDLAGARGAPSPKSSVELMERCASQTHASSSEACPWAVRLDRSSVSLPGGECGSSSARVARRSHSQRDVSEVRALKFQ